VTVLKSTPSVENEILQKKGERLAWGRSRMRIRTEPEKVVAYQMNFMARSLSKP
jgi:hypothetical protein